LGISGDDPKCREAHTVLYIYINLNRLSLAGCDVADGGATAIGSAISKNKVLIVSEVLLNIVCSA
jgi:hypothetical protein